MIIRATQRAMMSRAVTSTSVGKKALYSGASVSGQPRVANGQSAELNQVSRTSSSCSHPSPSGGVSPTWVSSPRYQTGSRCPHQSWREMHQGGIFSIESRYWRRAPSGMTRTFPWVTTSTARRAISSIRQNHCSEMSGSIRSPERWENGTVCVYGSSPRISPRSRSSATTAAWASAAVIPRNRSGASSVISPSSPITLIAGRSCLRPISKSFGS